MSTLQSATSSSTEDNRKIILKSAEGESFTVTAKVASASQLVKDMMANQDEDDDDDEVEPIMLPNVRSEYLKLVVEFCEYHAQSGKEWQEIEKPLKSANMRDVVSEFDSDFVAKLDQATLFELILAANYMDIKSLLDLTCAKVASMIKGKNPEEIRKTFGIVNDFTPEEEQQVKEENKWCEESN